MRTLGRWLLLGAMLALRGVAMGQSIPEVTAESLNGKPVSLPRDFQGKSAILIVGFSRAGGDQCGPFARRLAKEQAGVVNGSVTVYQIAMLESAPHMVRPLILHGMRGGIAKVEQDRFLPLFHDEKRWKQVVGFTSSSQNDAYLLLVSPEGSIQWVGHGQYSDTTYAELKQHLP